MKVVAFLPAKGSSSRIESKNMKLLDGKPLFLHTLEKLVNSKLFDDVYLDTESEDVIEAASEINCKILNIRFINLYSLFSGYFMSILFLYLCYCLV